MIKEFKKFINENYAGYFLLEKEKINKKIKQLFKKYDLPYILISNEIDDYQINSFNKINDDIFLDYEYYYKDINGKWHSYVKHEKIEDVKPTLLMIIWDFIEEKELLDPAVLLESLQGDHIESFKKILKVTKNKINFTSWIWELFSESDNQKELKRGNFQELLFKTHPEAVESFLTASDELASRGYDTGVKIQPYIINKYPEVKERVNEYNIKKDSKKYNL